MIDAKYIREITAKGLTYINDDGKEIFIDFEGCYLNSPTAFKRIDEWKEIGGRDAFADPPYIEFYTTPPTTFYFDSSDELNFIKIALYLAGEWQTFDRG